MANVPQTSVELAAPGEVPIRRALLSVSDKRGLTEFAAGLRDLGVEIVSTGGTARELEGDGIETRSVEDYTGFPEILDGRVKTLNPRIYAGLLAVRSSSEHVDTLREHAIEQAVEYGVRVMGVTVHFVDEGVDSGPVILQEAFQRGEAEEIEGRVHEIEHRLLPEVVRLIAAGAVSIDPAEPRAVRVKR